MVMSTTLFTNVNVFDGKKENILEKGNVLIDGNKIKSISAQKIDSAGATVIDGGGRTLMPAIIDSHVHLSIAAVSAPELLTQLPGYTTILVSKQAEMVLMSAADLTPVTTNHDVPAK